MVNACCPACRAQAPLPALGRVPCPSCGAPVLLAERYALLGPPPVEHGTDVVDGAPPLWEGRDVKTGGAVLVRFTGPGESHRMDRETTVLRGLHHPHVPVILDELQEEGVGRAIILSHPGTPTLESALERGLRVDARTARAFLVQLLEILQYLHELSPPVFHRHVHPRAVRWDGTGAVFLQDFARATDVAEDARVDPVLARAGYAPDKAADPVALDLYGCAATTVHLLTRTTPERLPRDVQGRPRFRQAANVDAELAGVLDRLLLAEGRDRFRSAREALAVLDAARADASTRRNVPVVVAMAGLVLVGVAGAVAQLVGTPPHAVPVAPVVAAPPAPHAPTPPATPAMAWLEVKTRPEGAELWVDGQAVGNAPMTLEHVVGTIRVEARAPGHANATRTLHLSGHQALVLELVPVAAPTPAPAPVEPPTHKPAPPRPAPVVPDDHGVFLAALKAAVSAQQSALVGCATGRDDRWRFEVTVETDGRISAARARDAREPASTRCAANVITAIQAPRPRARAVQAEVTVYVKPSFSVTAF